MTPPALADHPNYRADIDGLRAVAILSVIFFHFFPEKVRGGFIGVDIFFVISGFLISSIIFSRLELNSFSFFDFYSRRIRRIFPALIIVLIASLAAGWLVLLPNEYKQLGKHTIGGAGFVSNFLFWWESGYFDNKAITKPLLHLWSLAIEEQFYLIWPLLLFFAWTKKWRFFVVIAIIAISSFTFNLYFAETNTVADFYSPISRFWELMLGGILAYVALHKPHWNSKYPHVQSLLGLSLIIMGLLLIHKGNDFPGWRALLPTLGAFLLISAGPNGLANKYILSNRLFIWFGLISYPLYLWHWPLLSFTHILTGEPGIEIKLLLIVVAIALAWLTYKWIEKPLRFQTYHYQKTLALATIMTVVFISGIVVNLNMMRPKNSSATFENYLSAMNDWEYPNRLKPLKAIPRAFYINSRNSDTTLLIGDSHIEQYSPRVVDTIQNHHPSSNSAIFITAGGCLPIPGVQEDQHRTCSTTLKSALDLAKDKKIKSIVLGGAWNAYFIPEELNCDKRDSYSYYTVNHGKKELFCHGRGIDMALSNLEELIKNISGSKKVYLLLDNPMSEDFNPGSFFTGNRLGSIQIKDVTRNIAIDEAQLQLREKLIALANRAGAEIIDPTTKLCKGNICSRLTKDGKPIYKDNDHLRPFYVRENSDYIDKTLF